MIIFGKVPLRVLPEPKQSLLISTPFRVWRQSFRASKGRDRRAFLPLLSRRGDRYHV
jgi:hypothetical protein